ncbi:helix-turn-helix transcriptional regulator [Streptomyces sp. B1866]|uniref:helix-turn-helix domain-containing protein n=1 Tax=Streptomyces sp. B1866 TaxID=3075431 RepID=UPI002890C956|nr:helix-turn-helix transcriptional regulator [Streptomyces sp. B1866]MDT3397725.1 helix-turn-helix transcriptional regulator [Streptomyces sp. B1866]
MTQDDLREWSAQLTAAVVAEVRRRRKELGMSAQDLADACDDLGHPIPRNVIANLESGRRSTLTVADLLVLGKALEVPPLWLLFPLDHAAQVKALPGEPTETWTAFTWATGEKDSWHRKLCDLFRAHERANRVIFNAWYQRPRDEEDQDSRTDGDSMAPWLSGEQVTRALEDLRRVRTSMRIFSLPLPQLMPEISFIDPTSAQTENDEKGFT